jgi:hypothetical protein
MSDASQEGPEPPVDQRLADLIENMLNEWPDDRMAAKVTLDMTFDQWNELLTTLRRPVETCCS